MSEWRQYPDSTLRETYPPAPRSGGDPNKQVSDAVVGMIASQHAATRAKEAAFRERQRQRRLLTRGAAAMREPEDTPLIPPAIPIPQPHVLDDPDLAEYQAAGWV